jgi:hypothetical protein
MISCHMPELGSASQKPRDLSPDFRRVDACAETALRVVTADGALNEAVESLDMVLVIADVLK